MGEGKTLNVDHLLKLAKQANISQKCATEIIETTKASLAKWPKLAKKYGVSDSNIKLIKSKITKHH